MNKKNNTPWLNHYPPQAKEPFKHTPHPIHLLLENTAQRTPAAPAITFMDQTQDYQHVQQQTLHIAESLQNMGIKKGDRIALVLPNSPYYIIAYYAALRIGAIVVNTNPLYTEEELQHIFKDAKPKAIFTLDLTHIAPKVFAAAGKSPHIIMCPLTAILPSAKKALFKIFKRKEITPFPKHRKKTYTFQTLLQNDGKPKTIVIDPKKDVALLQYTGGTTGLPKGAMLTHANITTQTSQVSTWLGTPESVGLTHPHIFVAVLPFFHVFAMTACLNLPISTGAHIILMPRFEMKPLLKIISRYKVTLFPGVPTLFKAINKFYTDVPHQAQKFDLSSIQFCVSGGASLPERTKNNFEKLTGSRMVEGYGLTEASPVLACNPPHIPNKANSIGLPLPNTILTIRNPENTEEEYPLGEIGELCAQGPQVMLGYWENTEASQKTLVKTSSGIWLKTGDLARMDKSGYFYITDRLKDVILVNGYNVYPTVIEQALYKHDTIQEALVIGQPDEEKGELPYAYVVLKDGATCQEKDILNAIKKHLNPLERPARIYIRKELPKTLIGKPCRKTLREQELNK